MQSVEVAKIMFLSSLRLPLRGPRLLQFEVIKEAAHLFSVSPTDCVASTQRNP
jgi:hypothetical protein